MGSKMDLASFLALVLNFKPFIPLFQTSECAKLLLTISKLLVLANIVIEDCIFKVVTNILNVDSELLVVPSRFLASLLADLRLPFKLS